MKVIIKNFIIIVTITNDSIKIAAVVINDIM